jgi:hypothetical protein
MQTLTLASSLHSLESNKITDAGAIALATALPASKVTKLL